MARRGPVILLVEDAHQVYEFFSDVLADAGFTVEGASDGAEAVAKARALSPDLVLMDLSLPRMDGWEATRALKDDAGTRHIPVVAITGYVQRRYDDRSRAAGCDALLHKPCSAAELIAAVRQILADHETVRAPAFEIAPEVHA